MQTDQQRILFAGATGYLGNYVFHECLKRGHDVRAIVRVPQKLKTPTGYTCEVVAAEVTQPATLFGVCDDIDVVFSSIGITRQKDGLTFKDVDYQGNLNLLNEAKRAGVKKFIYVSVLNGEKLLHLDIVKAHEDFVAELKSSGLNWCVIRPTGYFSDMEEFLDMAKKGRVWLMGSGANRMNPIHGADLAKVCVDALDMENIEVNVGGPEIMTYREIAEAAFEALGSPTKISSVPGWLMKTLTLLTGIINPHQGALLAFFTTMMLTDTVASCTGEHRLPAHFRNRTSG